MPHADGTRDIDVLDWTLIFGIMLAGISDVGLIVIDRASEVIPEGPLSQLLPMEIN